MGVKSWVDETLTELTETAQSFCGHAWSLTAFSPVLLIPKKVYCSEISDMLNQVRTSRYTMSDQKDVIAALNSGHCRAICDEIGARLEFALRREISPIPPRLMALIDRLAELDESPSIVPSFDDMLSPMVNDPMTNVKRSTDQTRTATNRILAAAGF
jgi:hypothetical protein